MKEKGVFLVYTEIEKVTILQEMASSPLTGLAAFYQRHWEKSRVGEVSTTYFRWQSSDTGWSRVDGC